MTITVVDSIGVYKLLEQYKSLCSKLEWLEDDKTKQCSLQHLENTPSFTDGCGRIKIKNGKFLHQERDFSVCHDIIKNTIFEEIINRYKLFRTRFMIVKPKSCYSIHKDFGPRIHIPLITNPDAMFVFKDTGLHHLTTGKVYLVDTTKLHSFANFGDTERLHLIGCV